MGLAVVSLIVLVILGAVLGLVLARILGAAASRNDGRPDGEGAGDGGDEGQPTDEDMRKRKEAVKQGASLLGGAVALLGILLGLVGAVLATGVAGDASFSNTVPATTLGILLGLVGYFLRARTLGMVAIVFAVVTLIFGVAASQGLVPGLGPTDHGLPSQEPRSE